jgi:hypothetical protein
VPAKECIGLSFLCSEGVVVTDSKMAEGQLYKERD